jgi:hypothetical protein
MNKFVKNLGDRHARFELLHDAMKEFEQSTKTENGQYNYSYLAGFYMSQLLMLAADKKESTEELIRTINSVAKKQQSPISA